MLELVFQGLCEWIYGLILEAWQFFASVMLDVMSMDFAYLKTHIPVLSTIQQCILAAGWALLIGNLVFQAIRSMVTGLGFEGEDPKLLFTRTFVFSFLLLASPQICDLCLDMTSIVMHLMEMPDAVHIALADNATFTGLVSAWALVILVGLIVMFQSVKMLMKVAEQYVVLCILTISAPLAFGLGGSKSTSDVFTGWCRMYGSMCLLMVMNVAFCKILLSILSFCPSGLDVFPWLIMVFAIVKVAKKADAIITRIGLNPAMTGDPLKSGPGMLAYGVMRSMGTRVARAVGRNIGHFGSGRTYGGGRGPRPSGPRGGGWWGGRSTSYVYNAATGSQDTSVVANAATAVANNPVLSAATTVAAAATAPVTLMNTQAPAQGAGSNIGNAVNSISNAVGLAAPPIGGGANPPPPASNLLAPLAPGSTLAANPLQVAKEAASRPVSTALALAADPSGQSLVNPPGNAGGQPNAGAKTVGQTAKKVIKGAAMVVIPGGKVAAGIKAATGATKALQAGAAGVSVAQKAGQFGEKAMQGVQAGKSALGAGTEMGQRATGAATQTLNQTTRFSHRTGQTPGKANSLSLSGKPPQGVSGQRGRSGAQGRPGEPGAKTPGAKHTESNDNSFSSFGEVKEHSSVTRFTQRDTQRSSRAQEPSAPTQHGTAGTTSSASTAKREPQRQRRNAAPTALTASPDSAGSIPAHQEARSSQGKVRSPQPAPVPSSYGMAGKTAPPPAAPSRPQAQQSRNERPSSSDAKAVPPPVSPARQESRPPTPAQALRRGSAERSSPGTAGMGQTQVKTPQSVPRSSVADRVARTAIPAAPSPPSTKEKTASLQRPAPAMKSPPGHTAARLKQGHPTKSSGRNPAKGGRKRHG